MARNMKIELLTFSPMLSVLPSDKLHIHFCKYILGANKTSTSFAILSELGRIPFALDCFTSVLKYWYRLNSHLIVIFHHIHVRQLRHSVNKDILGQ